MPCAIGLLDPIKLYNADYMLPVITRLHLWRTYASALPSDDQECSANAQTVVGPREASGTSKGSEGSRFQEFSIVAVRRLY